MGLQKGCPIQTPLGGEKNHSGSAIHDLSSKEEKMMISRCTKSVH